MKIIISQFIYVLAVVAKLLSQTFILIDIDFYHFNRMHRQLDIITLHHDLYQVTSNLSKILYFFLIP